MQKFQTASFASMMASVALLTLAGTAGVVFSQETAPPPVDTAPKPAPVTTSPGDPRSTSAGGSEYKVPDRVGLFESGPLNLVDKPSRDAEKWLSENARLDLGFRAAFFFQQASGGPGERTGASQDYRIYGTFHAFNYEEANKGWAGNVYFRAEYRESMFAEIPPYELNTQIGSLTTTTYGQDEHSLAMVQLYYEQFMFDGKIRARIGKLDPDDYFNAGRWADDYRYFDNAILSAFPASNHPSGGLGVNFQWYISPEWTVTAGSTDVQGKKTHSGFDTIDDWDMFSAADLTYSPTISGWGKGNYRIGIEHRDGVPDKNKPQDNSYYINIDQEVCKDVAPFLRFGWGTGNSTGVADVFALGVGFDNVFERPGDAAGIGFGFDTPSDQTAVQRDAEYVVEGFYRFQLTRAMQFTVGQQIIFEPINTQTDDVVGVFEMRLVVDF